MLITPRISSGLRSGPSDCSALLCGLWHQDYSRSSGESRQFLTPKSCGVGSYGLPKNKLVLYRKWNSVTPMKGRISRNATHNILLFTEMGALSVVPIGTATSKTWTIENRARNPASALSINISCRPHNARNQRANDHVAGIWSDCMRLLCNILLPPMDDCNVLWSPAYMVQIARNGQKRPLKNYPLTIEG